MLLLTQAQRQQLLDNGHVNAAHRLVDGNTVDHQPVVKLFTPWGAATWLLSELDPDEPDHAFGLCDLGFGSPELGSVSLSELAALRGPFGLRVERDLYFEANGTSLTAYANQARAEGRISA